MGITVFYDLLGGMRAVVISDVVQLVLLLGAVLLALFSLVGPLATHFNALGDRTLALANDWGFTSGNDYGFWPMLVGGLFLYMAYYGCDRKSGSAVAIDPQCCGDTAGVGTERADSFPSGAGLLSDGAGACCL